MLGCDHWRAVKQKLAAITEPSFSGGFASGKLPVVAEENKGRVLQLYVQYLRVKFGSSREGLVSRGGVLDPTFPFILTQSLLRCSVWDRN